MNDFYGKLRIYIIDMIFIDCIREIAEGRKYNLRPHCGPWKEAWACSWVTLRARMPKKNSWQHEHLNCPPETELRSTIVNRHIILFFVSIESLFNCVVIISPQTPLDDLITVAKLVTQSPRAPLNLIIQVENFYLSLISIAMTTHWSHANYQTVFHSPGQNNQM